MKKILSCVHRSARLVFISGTVLAVVMVFVSALFHVGAGRVFEYYCAVDASEKLLALSRPVFVSICAGSLGLEYFFRHKN